MSKPWNEDNAAYEAGLAEGFRRGVQAMTDQIMLALTNSGHITAASIMDRIRALRPEGGSK